MIHFILYFAIGAMTGVLSGLIGVGGGVIIVPGLAFIFKQIGVPSHIYMQMAAATSLAVVFVTSCFSVLIYQKKGDILWPVWRKIVSGLVAGIIIGAFISRFFSGRFLELIFAIFLLFISFRLFFPMEIKQRSHLPRTLFLFFLGFLIGGLSGIVGVGGGVLLMPLFLYFNLPIRKASGTSIACVVIVSMMGSLTYAILKPAGIFISGAVGYLYFPAFLGVTLGSISFVFIGTSIAYRVNKEWLQRFLAFFLLFVAIGLLI
jgi:hypothetical protein